MGSHDARERYRTHRGRVWGPDFANVDDRPSLMTATTLMAHFDAAPSLGSPGGSGVPHGTVLQRYELLNGNGGSVRAYLGGRQPDGVIQFGHWQELAAGDSFTTATVGSTDAAAKSDSGSTFTAGTDTTADDGFGVESDRQFDLLITSVTTAVSAAPTWDIEYWNGTAWANVTLLESSLTTFTDGTGEDMAHWIRPTDWSSVAPPEGFTDGRFAMRFRDAGGAGHNAAVLEWIRIGRARVTVPLIPANGAIMADEQDWPLSGNDERPIVVFNTQGAHRASVHFERTPVVRAPGEIS